jgi:hypothetical protein
VDEDVEVADRPVCKDSPMSRYPGYAQAGGLVFEPVAGTEDAIGKLDGELLGRHARAARG